MVRFGQIRSDSVRSGQIRSDSVRFGKLQDPFQVAMSTWVVWQKAGLTHESFCPFFLSESRPQVASLDTSQRSIRHYASFPPRKLLLGVRKMKSWNLTPFTPKNVKIGTFSWQSMKNCNCHYSRMVSRIHLKLGTDVAQPSRIKGQGHKVT